MPTPTMTYDREADALYIALVSDRPVARTTEIDLGTLVDLDVRGRLLGVEVVRPARSWPLDAILDRYPVDAGTEAYLRSLFPPDADAAPYPVPLVSA